MIKVSRFVKLADWVKERSGKDEANHGEGGKNAQKGKKPFVPLSSALLSSELVNQRDVLWADARARCECVIQLTKKL